MERKLIMLVDDDPVNLLTGKKALSEHYQTLTLPSAAAMFNLLPRYKPELILLDVNMPDMDGFDAILHLKNDPSTRNIPIVFLTAEIDPESEIRGLELGALDYISKPFSPPLLLKRVEAHLALVDYQHLLEEMVAKKTEDIMQLQLDTLDILADLAEQRDTATGSHNRRSEYCFEVMLKAMAESEAFRADIETWDIPALLRGVKLHDIGKIAITDAILKKPGKLEPEEFEVMKTHVMFGVKFIEKLESNSRDSLFLQYAKTLATYHHEKWNGSGYPNQLAGEAIPLLGRVMAIVDVYEALTAERPYKKAFDHDTAMQIINEGRGTYFDPALVDLLVACSEQMRCVILRHNDDYRSLGDFLK
ncbi:two-component system response regulator [Betaproteobacteria bacterium]|nr:two-component system response regulator [Betaproteobacteria bacterium]